MQNTCSGSQSLFRALLCAAGTLLLMTVAVGVQRLQAQATGTITGTVTDSTGGAIADAAVQIKNAGTGIVQNAVTDAVVVTPYRSSGSAITMCRLPRRASTR